MGFELGIIGGFSLEGYFSSLIGVIWGNEGIFGFFGAELCVIGCCALEFASFGGVQVAAVFRSINGDFFGLVVLLVFGFVIELPTFWSILVLIGRDGLIFYLVWHILLIISSLKQGRVIMPLMVVIGAWSLYLVDDSCAWLIIMVIGCLPIEWLVAGRWASMVSASADLAHTHCVVLFGVFRLVGQSGLDCRFHVK